LSLQKHDFNPLSQIGYGYDDYSPQEYAEGELKGICISFRNLIEIKNVNKF
jgi:hypothetical protein